jgi:hypothetical protein
MFMRLRLAVGGARNNSVDCRLDSENLWSEFLRRRLCVGLGLSDP